MTKQTLNKGSAANDGTGDTLRQGATKIQANFDELYAILGGNTLSSGISFNSTTNGISFEGASETFLVPTNTGNVDKTITLPNATGTVVLNVSTQTLTNKTLTSPVLTTPQINDTSANHQYVFAVSELSADRNVTLPLLTGHDEFTFNAHAQTLTNKTLTTPAITSPKITTSINDANGAEVIEVPATADADNHLKITNADGASPTIESVGANSNVGLNIGSKGTGLVTIASGFAFESITQGGDGEVSLVKTTTVFNKGSPLAATLANGTVVGQLKILTNKGSGAATTTQVSSNFGFGASIALAQHKTATLLWDGNHWQIQSTYGGTVA
jgi:hypothetical protein